MIEDPAPGITPKYHLGTCRHITQTGKKGSANRLDLRLIAPCIDCCVCKGTHLLQSEEFLQPKDIRRATCRQEAKCMERLNTEFRKWNKGQLDYEVPLEYEVD